MPAIAQPSSAELKEHVASVEDELAAVKAKLPAALRSAAEGFLGGRTDDQSSSLRTQIRRLSDVLSGLRDLAALAEHRELVAEIKRREAAYEEESERLEGLRRVATRADRAIEGTGSAFAAAVREDRETRNRDFKVYEEANVTHMAERARINALIAHRNKLEGDLAQLV